MQGMSALFQARFEEGAAAWADVQRSCERSGNWQIECWARMGQGDHLVRMGRDAEAVRLYHGALDRFAGRAQTTERIWACGMLALASLRLGDRDAAVASADETLALVTGARPVAYWTQYGTAAAAEVFLALAEAAAARGVRDDRLLARAGDACAGLSRFARVFQLGLPFALLLTAHYQHLLGHRTLAMRRWQQCASLAERVCTPYELGRAQLEIGRHLPPGTAGRRGRLEQAADVFRRHGALRDLERAEAALAGDEDATGA